MSATIRFLGAAGTVTGSRHLLEFSGRRILIDCGLFQGRRQIRRRNWEPFPVSADSLDAVVITHGHLDHVGYLPRLVKFGFRGPVYANAATAEVMALVLRDSARIQEEEARHANRHGWSRHTPAAPLYTSAEAEQALNLVITVSEGAAIDLGAGVAAHYVDAGHILGSRYLKVRFSGGRTVVFSGDVGRYGQPIIADPKALEAADFLVMESTYGGRTHGAGDSLSDLAEAVNDTVKRGGVMVIPAFAIGRTQNITYLLRELARSGRTPSLPTYVDSPMAISAVKIYVKHTQEHDLEARELADEGLCPIYGQPTYFTRSVEESKAINRVDGPAIIISASGMLMGGRILHHLMRRLPHPQNTLLFVGFQPQGSLGRRLLEGAKSVTMHRKRIQVRARVTHINKLSAHADEPELLRWVSRVKQAPRETFLVHGEPSGSKALKQAIEARYGWKVCIPKHLERRRLDW